MLWGKKCLKLSPVEAKKFIIKNKTNPRPKGSKKFQNNVKYRQLRETIEKRRAWHWGKTGEVHKKGGDNAH